LGGLQEIVAVQTIGFDTWAEEIMTAIPIQKPVDALLQKGVRISNPCSVAVGPEVDIDRISGEDVVIHPGCRIFGQETLVSAGVRLGAEGPVTVENCQIGPGVELKGGFFKDAVFLAGSSCGSGSHVRAGTILEEFANIAHTVGLKQTILFPFVTLGSLINFCDCLMAGGTGRKNHSEVGSSYIHFNFTPNQDKATASLIGDVPRGVMLNQSPIFLGGQGGMVGPVRLNYGTTVAAGTILRKDELRPNRLIFGGAARAGNVEFRPGRFSSSARILKNNLIYIANLLALRKWYEEVRVLFVCEHFPQTLLEGLLRTVQSAIDERLRRLKELAEKIKAGEGDPVLAEAWPAIEAALVAQQENMGDRRLADSFKESVLSAIDRSGKDYIAVIQALDLEQAGQGTDWLQGIVDRTVADAFKVIREAFPADRVLKD
jgi:UDP-N-acetylglucosamine/UDP-N-acetylgalactosamine diphosphorylase